MCYLLVCKGYHLKATQNAKVALSLFTWSYLTIHKEYRLLLFKRRHLDSSALNKRLGLLAWIPGPVRCWHLPVAVNPWAPLVCGLSAAVPPAHMMALPRVWEFSFSIACYPDRNVSFRLHSVHPESLLFALFCTLILRRLSWEEGWGLTQSLLVTLINYPDYLPAVAALCCIFSSLKHWEKKGLILFQGFQTRG